MSAILDAAPLALLLVPAGAVVLLAVVASYRFGAALNVLASALSLRAGRRA